MATEAKKKSSNILTVKEAASLLGKCRATLYNWKEKGLIKFEKVGKYTVIKRTEVERIKREMGKDES